MTSLWRGRIAQLAAVLGALALLFGCGWFALSRLADGLCGNEILAEVPSPDGRFRLVSFQRDCGATTDFSTQISLLETGEELPNSSGNVFISDGGAAPSSSGGGPEVRMRWDGPRTVSIEHHVAARVFLQEAACDGVRITYATFTN
jgi:hypothetical protein